ncbi:hypothetical protein AB0K09_28275 [Streptomyces sp. NPDC049577]|uniref:DUF7848 domain-containing protein n=1 Tax=Streptomyces sp. NPDC049577 TaxID=3155153 RepID=UPI0034297A08
MDTGRRDAELSEKVREANRWSAGAPAGPVWLVQPRDDGRRATEHTYAQECDSCGHGSRRTADPADGTLWILKHVTGNPTHTAYTQTVKRAWRARRQAES